jgi:4-amino-4-deoxy-L-arabinose transferase-like glycosyltransferase
MALWMANREPFWLGPLWGLLIVVLSAGAWVAWIVQPSEAPAEAPATPLRDTWLGKRNDERVAPLLCVALCLATLAIGAALGGYDALPITILLALSCLLPAAGRRPGLAVMCVVSAMYLPWLGATGLWDPWETHYGEVAREVLARNDWISLWWAQDKWFWSKPVLLFWMEALSMGALGIDFMPDANPAQVEWAIRLPTALTALTALAAIYLTVRRFFGARAGALAVLVTATMPQFFFISHQAITDLPLVAAIVIGACFLMLALQEDPEREATLYAIGPWKVSLQHFVCFVLVALVLPQAVYLISRNFSFIEGAGLVAHPDRFLYGSGGNFDVPGNPNPRDQLPAMGGLLKQPFIAGMIWLALLGSLLSVLRKERRARALLMFAFYISCAIGFMAKGLPGVAIPGAAALFYLLASRRWSLLGNGGLRVALGVCIVSVISLPWVVAMIVRHGFAFTNRLFVHDHINRLAAGVHGDKGSIEYFVSQIGYATFPWIALGPLAGLFVARELRSDPQGDRAQPLLFLTMWLVSSFVLFSAMVTKFHHYILPAIVPGGILVGIAIAEWWGEKSVRATWTSAAAGVLAALGFAWLLGDPRGVIPPAAMHVDDWILQRAEPMWGLASLGGALFLLATARARLERRRSTLDPPGWTTAVGIALVVGACLVAFVGRDMSWVTSARPQGYERLIHLFVYNYRRAWPEHLDYRAALSGVAIATTLVVALTSLRSWRSVAVRALCGIAVGFCAWGLHVYMAELSQHWSQRDLAARYYESRQGPEEPLLAWQMNWKGENFYTGNRVYVFAETDNKRIKKWLKDNPGRRVYVLLEHSRMSRFQKLVPSAKLETLSDERDNNKIALLRLAIPPRKRLESEEL